MEMDTDMTNSSGIMTIIDGTCWKCDHPMKVAVTEGIISSYCGPDEFSDAELAFARSKGAIIELHESKSINEKYLANTCPACNAFAGNFYLFTQYVQPASIGEFAAETYDVNEHLRGLK